MHFARINITLYPLHFCGWLQVLIDVWASGVPIGPKTSVSWWTGWPSLHHLLELMEKLLEEEIRYMSLLKAFWTKKSNMLSVFQDMQLHYPSKSIFRFWLWRMWNMLKRQKNPVPKFTSLGDCLYFPGLQLVTFWLHSTVDEGIWFRYETEWQKAPFTFSGKYVPIKPVRTLQLNLPTTTATLVQKKAAIVERWPL